LLEINHIFKNGFRVTRCRENLSTWYIAESSPEPYILYASVQSWCIVKNPSPAKRQHPLSYISTKLRFHVSYFSTFLTQICFSLLTGLESNVSLNKFSVPHAEEHQPRPEVHYRLIEMRFNSFLASEIGLTDSTLFCTNMLQWQSLAYICRSKIIDSSLAQNILSRL